MWEYVLASYVIRRLYVGKYPPASGGKGLALEASDMACNFMKTPHSSYVKQGDIYCANALKLNSWVLMGGHSFGNTDMQIIHEGSLFGHQ